MREFLTQWMKVLGQIYPLPYRRGTRVAQSMGVQLSTQDCGEQVDTPSMMQGSPLLEASLTVSIDILVERVEHTPVVPSVEVVTGVVSEFLGDSNPQQMGEVPGDISALDEAPGDTKVLDDGHTQQCH